MYKFFLSVTKDFGLIAEETLSSSVLKQDCIMEKVPFKHKENKQAFGFY